MSQLGRLKAEIAAWPFWSRAALAGAITTLARNDALSLTASTNALYKELELYLRPRGRGASLNLLIQLRDARWFSGGEHSAPLHVYVERLAKECLVNAGESVRLRQSGKQEEDAALWRWLSLALPPDLLLCALNGTGDQIDLVPADLSRLLEQEVAEIHTHLSACISFGMLWTHVMAGAGGLWLDAKKLDRGGPPPFGDGARFRDWLVAAALARVTLAAFLVRHAQGSRFRSLAEYLASGFTHPDDLREHRATLSMIARGQQAPMAALTRALYRRFAGVHGAPSEVKGLDELRSRDPLATSFRNSNCLPETEFCRRSLRYLAGYADEAFALLFWQYTRIRCSTYRHLVQEPGTGGLDWFACHFARISALRKGLSDDALVESAWQLQGRGLNLRSLEVRAAPESIWHKVSAQVRTLAKPVASHSPRPNEQPERGLVLHFKKEWVDQQQRRHGDPRQPFFGTRYGRYFRERQREAMAIGAALTSNPLLLVLLRGLDVCSEELAIPNWVLLPLLTRLRTISEQVVQRLVRAGLSVQSLRLTLHAGEDFRTLHEGLRRLHEPIEFGWLRSSDRLGHAVALGVDPERWRQGSLPTVQPAEERLDDLLWELARYQEGSLRASGSHIEVVRAEVARLGAQVFGSPATVEDLIEARHLRHNAERLERWGYPSIMGARPHAPPERLLFDYLTDGNVFLRGQQPVEILYDSEAINCLHQAQNLLRKEMGRRHITVEANPSSNLLIADFEDLARHPMFILKPLPTAPPSIPPVPPVALGLSDDDPVTFATCLADEYALVYFALIRHGCTSPEALTWLESARRDAWRARFTLPVSRDVRVLTRLVTRP